MILIQKAHLGNLPQYQIFLQKRDVNLPGVSDSELCIKRMHQLVTDKHSALFFAWNNLNKIVGELSLSTSSRQFGTHISECGIHIHHQYRRQKLGKRLVQEAIQWAEQNSIHRIEWYTNEDNSASNRLAEQKGFYLESTKSHAYFDGFYCKDVNLYVLLVGDPPRPTKGIVGHLDSISPILTGWAYDIARPNHPLKLNIMVNQNKITEIVADRSRPDVSQAGHYSSNCGFHWVIPDTLRNTRINFLELGFHGKGTIFGSPCKCQFK